MNIYKVNIDIKEEIKDYNIEIVNENGDFVYEEQFTGTETEATKKARQLMELCGGADYELWIVIASGELQHSEYDEE